MKLKIKAEPLPKRAKLLNGGEVQFTDSNGIKMAIVAEHAKDGGWTLAVNFPGDTVYIDLPPRVSVPGLGSAMAHASRAMNGLSNASYIAFALPEKSKVFPSVSAIITKLVPRLRSEPSTSALDCGLSPEPIPILHSGLKPYFSTK